MSTWSRQPLSVAPQGKPVVVDATSSPGTTVHAVSSATTTKDAVYVWGFNYATTQSQVTFEMGSTASTAAMIQVLPALSGVYAIIPGMAFVGGTATGVIAAFATASNRVSLFGYVDRAT